MFPTPKGYISIPDAVDRVSRALHGEPKTIPWRGKDLDEAVLRSGREQTVEAIEWMIAELSAGRLVAQVGNYELAAEYWTRYGAYTTAHTGCLQPPEMDAGDYAKFAYQPCFIERSVFEERLSTIGDGSIKQFATKEARDEAYAEHVVSVREETGRAPTFKADRVWGISHSLGRDKMRDLRKKCPHRTDDDRRGGTH